MPTDTLARLVERDAKARLRARETRDDLLAAIDEEYRGGRTVRELAERTGLSFQRIYQLVTRPGGPGPRRLRHEASE
jgi:hypothetical protein